MLDSLRVNKLTEHPDDKASTRRQLKIHTATVTRVDNANQWDDADSLQVVGVDTVADVSLNSSPVIDRI